MPSEVAGDVRARREPSFLWGGSSVAWGTGSRVFRSSSGVVRGKWGVWSELGVFPKLARSARCCPELGGALFRTGGVLFPKLGYLGWHSLSLYLACSDLPQLH